MTRPQNASSRGLRLLREILVKTTVATANTSIAGSQTSIRSVGKGEGNTMVKGSPA